MARIVETVVETKSVTLAGRGRSARGRKGVRDVRKDARARVAQRRFTVYQVQQPVNGLHADFYPEEAVQRTRRRRQPGGATTPRPLCKVRPLSAMQKECGQSPRRTGAQRAKPNADPATTKEREK